MKDTIEVTQQPYSIELNNSLLVRSLDVIISGFGLVVFAPFFLIISVCIKLTDSEPIFVVQRREQKGRIINLFKFNTVGKLINQKFQENKKQIESNRTILGAFLYRTKLDELPQLVNVFRGEISLVNAYLAFQRVAIETLKNREIWEKMIFRLRNRHFLLGDIAIFLLTPAIALQLRVDASNWWSKFGSALVIYTIIALFIKVFTFYRFRLYRRYWRYASVNDLIQVLIATGFATCFLTLLFVMAQNSLNDHDLAFPRTVPIIDGLVTVLFAGGTRFGVRALYHRKLRVRAIVGGRRVLVVGAGEAGKLVVSEMRANPQLNMEPVAFIDDDKNKVGTHVQGLPVLGTCQDISIVVEQHQIQRTAIAIPSASLKRQNEIAAICQQTGAKVHSLPGVYELLAGYKAISPIPKVNTNELLCREPIITDLQRVAESLADATVLVTGAGGSIGSELCRQVARHKPKQIILLGHGENSIFEISLNLRLSYPDLTIIPTIADVRDQQRIMRVVESYRPGIIFHAAAHKHVPFMEEHVEEAITNNILGTHNMLRAAEEYGVERFVLISTDKAVNPTSIMGATKRMAEFLVMAAAQRSGQNFMAVRFGNVLGSRGSVLRVFQQQIAAGGPLTITHPDMERYFMTIPEAVELVLQAGVLGKGGEAFVLDMEQPVRIFDMATNLLKLTGLEPGRDIEIAFTGIRPGEKLNEELFLAGENYQGTEHPKIFMITPTDEAQTAVLERVVLEFINLTVRMQGQNSAERLQYILAQICSYVDKQETQVRSLPATIESAGLSL